MGPPFQAQRWRRAEAILSLGTEGLRQAIESQGRAELAKPLATALTHLGLVLQALGRLAQAEACQRENVAIWRRLAAVETRQGLADHLLPAGHLAAALGNHGSVLQGLGRLAEAEACQRENVALCTELVEGEARAGFSGPLAAALNNHGLVLRALGRLVEAEACQRESVAIRRRLVEVENRGEFANAASAGQSRLVLQALAGWPRRRPASARMSRSAAGCSRSGQGWRTRWRRR
jgi:tetratricopeptide (TPR) repeat protein